jgi:hypothetical protein
MKKLYVGQGVFVIVVRLENARTTAPKRGTLVILYTTLLSKLCRPSRHNS